MERRNFVKKMKWRIDVIKRRHKYIFSLKTISSYLKNGFYYLDNNSFKKVKTFSNHFLINCIKGKIAFIISLSKIKCVNKGFFIKNENKSTLVSDYDVLSFFHNKEWYQSIKKRMIDYLELLPYPHVHPVFDDSKMIIKTELAKGRNYSDKEHFNMNISLIFSSLETVEKTPSNFIIYNKLYTIYECVQHGDFHELNIFWDGNKPIMIDLDDIDYRPLFYDLFYYVDKYYEGGLNKWIGDSAFEKEITRWLINHGLKSYGENIDFDLYLAAFAHSWLKDAKEDYPLFIVRWHMSWAVSFDFDNYPLTKSIIKQYSYKLKLLDIKL